MNTKYSFQYCPKLVIFSSDGLSVLLAKRKGENDYDGTFSFIGGKIETTDTDINEGIKREKREEIGTEAKVKFSPFPIYTAFYRKKDGSAMILPHHLAKFIKGKINLNEEYSEYKWVKLSQLKSFEPKIHTIISAVERAKKTAQYINDEDYLEI